MRRANWNAWWARDFIVLDGANESAVEVEDDEVSQLTCEAAVTTEGQDERDERRGDGNKRQRQGERAEVVDDGGEMAEAGGEAGTAARSAASYAALTDITERRGVTGNVGLVW